MISKKVPKSNELETLFVSKDDRSNVSMSLDMFEDFFFNVGDTEEGTDEGEPNGFLRLISYTEPCIYDDLTTRNTVDD